MKWTNVTRMLTTSVAAAILSVALASCGGSDSGATDAGASSGHGNDASAAGGVNPKVGRTFCSAIKEVQSQLNPDAKSAAYLAQLTLKLDPAENAKLSAAEVDKATKKECPTEFKKFLAQAQITSLRDVGLQP